MPKCNKDQIINPATNRCVKKTGKIGKQVLGMNPPNYADEALKKKASVRKTSPKKAPARKASPKKAPAPKASPKKAPARKASPKKTPARKASPKKAPARKASPKKPPARKASAKKQQVRLENPWRALDQSNQNPALKSPPVSFNTNYGEERLVKKGERVYLNIAPMIMHENGGSPFDPIEEDVEKVALWYGNQMEYTRSLFTGFKYNGYWIADDYTIVLDLTINDPSGFYGNLYLNASGKNIGAWDLFANPDPEQSYPIHINDGSYYVVNDFSKATSASDY